MKLSNKSKLAPLLLVLAWIVPAALAQQPQPRPTSVPSSPSSDTRVDKRSADGRRQSSGGAEILPACNAAADELRASRELIAALDAENVALERRLETEKQISAKLSELDESRKAESQALNAALAAKDEAIRSKDVVIASQEKLITALKNKRPGPWRRISDILIGAAVVAILK